MANFNGLVVENNTFTEKEADFENTLGKMLFLKKEMIPEYEFVVTNNSTGEIVDGAIVNERGRLAKESVLDPDAVSVTSRPIPDTHVSTTLFFQSYGFEKQIEVSVTPEVGNKIDEEKDYRKPFTLVKPSANFWTSVQRTIGQGGTPRYNTTTGWKFHAEGVTPVTSNIQASTHQSKSESKSEQK